MGGGRSYRDQGGSQETGNFELSEEYKGVYEVKNKGKHPNRGLGDTSQQKQRITRENAVRKKPGMIALALWGVVNFLQRDLEFHIQISGKITKGVKQDPQYHIQIL